MENFTICSFSFYNYTRNFVFVAYSDTPETGRERIPPWILLQSLFFLTAAQPYEAEVHTGERGNLSETAVVDLAPE